MLTFWIPPFLLVGIVALEDRHQLPNAASGELFSEELLIKSLPSGHVYAQFCFSTSLHNPAEPLNFYRLFPMTVGELLQANAVDEFHLSLTQGKWSHENWGYPVKDRPAGALLWAWFKENPEENWKKFAAALGGITCSSLNFIDDTITAIPKYVFRPEGHLNSVNATNLRLALLPGEAVCTENLTPWLKLLPCSNAGLSQLLKATSVFSSHFISIGMDVKKTCLDNSCSHTRLLLQQYVTVVMDPTFGPRRQDWNFMILFGKTISAVCPLASKSSVLVDLTPNGVSAAMTLSPEPHRLEKADSDREFAIYDIKRLLQDHGHANIYAKFAKNHMYWTIKPPPITVNRYLQGYGLDQGGIRAIIKNNHYTFFNVTYLEIIPWYLRVYVHTLTVTSNTKRIYPNRIVFQPALDREKPYHLEIGLTLEPYSRVEVFFAFERAFLVWTEYPPDPHLGFYIGAASLTTRVPSQGLANFTGDLSASENLELALLHRGDKTRYLVLFTEILLVTLPTPDFSMPYNVICFVCTALALAFGPIHNITTKNLVLQDKTQKKGFIYKILQKLKGVSTRKAKKE